MKLGKKCQCRKDFDTVVQKVRELRRSLKKTRASIGHCDIDLGHSANQKLFDMLRTRYVGTRASSYCIQPVDGNPNIVRVYYGQSMNAIHQYCCALRQTNQ